MKCRLLGEKKRFLVQKWEEWIKYIFFQSDHFESNAIPAFSLFINYGREMRAGDEIRRAAIAGYHRQTVCKTSFNTVGEREKEEKN